MTATEVSKAYADLHERWPELRPTGIGWNGNSVRVGPHWYTKPCSIVMDDDLAHAACLVACLRACAERFVDVEMVADDNTRFNDGDWRPSVSVDIESPHTITAVMDRVMQLPKVST